MYDICTCLWYAVKVFEHCCMNLGGVHLDPGLFFLVFGIACLSTWRVSLAPYLVIAGALFPIQLRMSTDVPVLVGVLAGLGFRKCCHNDSLASYFPPLNRLWPFILFGVSIIVAAASAQAIHSPTEWKGIAFDSFWFLVRVCAVVLSIYWLPTGDGYAMLGRPLALGTTILALMRLGQQLQIAVFDRFADLVPLISDYRVPTNYNIFAALIVVALAFAAGDLLGGANRAVSRSYWAMVPLLIWSLSTTLSRAGILAGFLVLGLSTLVNRGYRSRLTGVGLMITLVATAWWNGGIKAKPFIQAKGLPPSVADTLALADQGRPLSWRSAITTANTGVEQEIRVPEAGLVPPELHLYAKRGSGSGPYTVRVWLDKSIVYTADATVFDPNFFRWERIPLPPESLANKFQVLVRIDMSGRVDARENYIEVAGFDVANASYTSRWFNGFKSFSEDLSSDNGIQKGIYGILLGNQHVQGTPVRYADAEQQLDRSISERFILWNTALCIFQQHPWLGSGFYSFRLLAEECTQGIVFNTYANAHNTYLQILADLGLLGAFAYITLLSVCLYRMSGWGSDQGWRWAGIGALGSLILISLAHVWMADVRYYIPAFLLMSWAGLSKTNSSS